MVTILNFIIEHWVAWLFTAIGGILTYTLTKLMKSIEIKMDEEHRKQDVERLKNEAIAEGMQCLLRDAIISAYNKYSDKGYCPIYAKESLKRGYQAYHALNGNDVATKLYNYTMDLPSDPQEESED